MNILVFQHVASEHPGSLREVMRERGCAMRAVELDEGEAIPPLEDFNALLVMGGPMDVWETDKHPWLVEEMAAIRQWVEGGRPYLGICLGHQLLAQALGGEVGRMDKPEVGMSRVQVADDPIFAGLPALWPCMQWHGAEVKRLPEGAVALATSPGCAIQAQRWGRAAYGLQFHIEPTRDTTAEWSRMPSYKKALERARGPGGFAAMAAEVQAEIAGLNGAARVIFSNFLDIASG
ncbi:type 1 glutamine amidotransferase [Acidocella sp.]|uniref:type 1 glutamine amidotransferase n=1 Tax=Acidocella sp. TaxID=50710 RepID=UPI002630E374|nr:type 1 glutamine amidotransferase [Acidocella sp.]